MIESSSLAFDKHITDAALIKALLEVPFGHGPLVRHTRGLHVSGR
jgi:hypothetical protein